MLTSLVQVLGSLWRFVFWFFVALLALILAILLGSYGAWYLAWVLGTGMMVLIAAAGGALLDSQEEAEVTDPSSASYPLRH